MEVIEASTSTDGGNFHVLPWKLPLPSMKINILQPTSMEIFVEVNLLPPTSMEASMEVGGNSYGSRSNGNRWTLMEVLWKLLGVCGTRRSRWYYVGVYGSSWKLPRNIFAEAAIIDGTNGSFHVHRQTVEPAMYFHGCFH